MLSGFGLVPTKASYVKIGDVFGRLYVIATGQISGTYKYYAICLCSCGGAPKRVRMDGLKRGIVQSCGCLQKDRTTTHRMTGTLHYHRWRGIMDRCYNQKCSSFKDYGGRGIRVCDAWHDLPTFVAQLPGGYFDGAEIDRIDNNGHYEPGNVRWVTRKKNCNNRRSCHLLEFNGRTMTLAEWSDEVELPLGTLWTRVSVWGWDAERALTTPPLDEHERMAIARAARWGDHIKAPRPTPRVPKTVMLNGETMTIADLSARTGIKPKLLRKRIFERGWPVERAAIP